MRSIEVAAALLLLALAAPGAAGLAAAAAAPSSWGQQVRGLFGGKAQKPQAAEEPKFCVVVRTYWGHSTPGGGGGLRRLLRSLQRQNITRWEAVLVVLDNRPFPDLHQIVQEFDDDRVWVFAEWIGHEFAPKEGAEWAPNYHGHLYNLTDDAIAVCPPDTTWLLVTNGDNEYGEGFFATAAAAGAREGADIVAFDFYSRFQRITAPACDRFSWYTDAPACKRNRLSWCHSDLGANVLNWRRLVGEGRRFGGLAEHSMGLGADHYDGIMAQQLLAGGWGVAHLHDVCLFNHAPSLQSCGWGGGVWDDRDVVSWETAGGRCLTPAQADAVMASDPNAEEVTITASNDRNVAAFEGVDPQSLLVRCLRRKDYESGEVLGAAMDWFTRLCADDIDLPAFKAWDAMKDPTAAAEAEAAEATAAAAAAGGSGGGGGGAAEGREPQDYWDLQQQFYAAGEAPAPDAAHRQHGHQQQEATAAGEGGGGTPGAEAAAAAS